MGIHTYAFAIVCVVPVVAYTDTVLTLGEGTALDICAMILCKCIIIAVSSPISLM